MVCGGLGSELSVELMEAMYRTGGQQKQQREQREPDDGDGMLQPLATVPLPEPLAASCAQPG